MLFFYDLKLLKNVVCYLLQQLHQEKTLKNQLRLSFKFLLNIYNLSVYDYEKIAIPERSLNNWSSGNPKGFANRFGYA